MSGVKPSQTAECEWRGPERSDYPVTLCARLGLDGKGRSPSSTISLALRGSSKRPPVFLGQHGAENAFCPRRIDEAATHL
jgi:hypothetical protein